MTRTASNDIAANAVLVRHGEILPPEAATPPVAAAAPALTPAGEAALAVAQALAKKATAPATLRAYKADWTHFSQWCAERIKGLCGA